MKEKILSRNEIDPKYTWNAPSVFESDAAWETELKHVLEKSIAEFKMYQGRLGESPAVLADAFDALNALLKRAWKVLDYAFMSHSVDTANQAGARMLSQAEGLEGQALAAVSFVDPELLQIGEETLTKWVQQESRLTLYAHYVHNLFRKQAHVRSAEVEELLGMLAEPFSATTGTATKLTDADFSFKPAITRDSNELAVTQGSIDQILANADREARRTAWEHYTDTYLAFKNTLASSLETSMKQNAFLMRARRHNSTLEASLFEQNIPVDVFHNLIETFRKHLPMWHRYWRIRRNALGLETLHPCDIWAPLTMNPPHIPYEQAVEWIYQGLTPMGKEYVDVIKKGCLEDRWVDVYPNKGKTGGAFSAGVPGTYPFILMSYTDDVFSLSTLAHELGHSMHSYLTWKHQPVIYGDYSLFVAEVASNFHQAMVRAYLLEHNPDPAFQISLLEEAMSNFHRYFFIMPTLARFELEVHQRIEQGKGLTAEDMIELMSDLFDEGYGGEMHVDRKRVGITWATFTHLYMDYYVYQYATGISGAYALSKRILSGEEGAVDAYLSFLKAGGSMYALDVLKMAGVDLTTTFAIEEAFNALSEMVDRLEKLLSK